MTMGKEGSQAPLLQLTADRPSKMYPNGWMSLELSSDSHDQHVPRHDAQLSNTTPWSPPLDLRVHHGWSRAQTKVVWCQGEARWSGTRGMTPKPGPCTDMHGSGTGMGGIMAALCSHGRKGGWRHGVIRLCTAMAARWRIHWEGC